MKTFALDPKRAALQASPLFEGLPNRHLARMAACFDVAQVAPEVTLLREGVRADALWIIVEGKVELCARGRRLGRVGRGEVLGAAAMFARGGAELTAVAVGPVRVLVASYLQLNQLIADPEVERRLRASAVFSLNQAGLPNLINIALTNSRPPARVRAEIGNDDGPQVPVVDSGIGIPADQQGNVFERFHRVDRPDFAFPGGTGLGPYSARQHAEAIGGTLALDWSETNVGSAFSLRLPAAASPSPGDQILPSQQAGN